MVCKIRNWLKQMLWRKNQNMEVLLRFLCSHNYLKCVVWSHTDSSPSSILQLHFRVQLFLIFFHNIRQIRTSAALCVVLFTMAIVRLIRHGEREKSLLTVKLKILSMTSMRTRPFPRLEYHTNDHIEIMSCSLLLCSSREIMYNFFLPI